MRSLHRVSSITPFRGAYPEISDPARPAWHFHPPAYWMNDPNGIIHHNGWWHLFYQHNPGGDEWADMHWGHARSRDLLYWEHLPIALQPQQIDGELHCYSGCCVLNAAGEPRILYTSVPPAPGRATQVIATPDDEECRAWTQHVTAPVLDLATHDGPAFEGDWRDPYVFQAEGRTFLILGACIGRESVVALYENPDGNLHHWTYRGNLLCAPRQEVPFYECPSIVFLNGRWVLFVSPCKEMQWFTGTLDLQNFRFHVENHGWFDASLDYYATHAKPGPDGRVFAFGWIRHFPKQRGWNGCLAVPREVWLGTNGELCTAPLREITGLHADETSFAATTLAQSPLRLELGNHSACHGELVLRLPDGGSASIGLAGITTVIATNEVRFADRPGLTLPAEAQIRFRWLLDRSVLELFVNDRACFTRVIACPAADELVVQATPGTELISARAFALKLKPGGSTERLAATG